MKNKKIILSITLMVMAAVIAYSQQYNDEKDFKAERDPNEDGIMISEYIGLKGEVNIPPRIQNVAVTGIKAGAFRNKSLTKINIPNTVKWIGDRAFQGNRFTSVIIPNSVTSIGDDAFRGCTNLTSVTFQGRINSSYFKNAFDSDLRDAYFESDGGPGTYTILADDNIWRNQRQAKRQTTTAAQSLNVGRLVIWSFTDELANMTNAKTWGYRATHPRVQVEYSQTPSDQFQRKLDPVLQTGQGTPDIIALESAFVRKYVESGKLLDITDIYEANKSKLLAYPVEVGTYKGRVYAMSWQACPGAMFYRRSLAKKYLGTDDPKTVQTYFSDFNKFLETAQLLKTKSNGSCVVVSSLGDLRNSFLSARKDSWLVNGKLVIDPVMDKYMDICKTLHDNRWEGRVGQWSEGWFNGMKDELRDEYGNRVEVFSYFLPTWGLHYVLKTNAPQTSGDWAMIQGPSAYRWSGTWVGAYKGTKNAPAVKEFIRYITTDDAFLEAWAKDTGDMVSNLNVINKIKDNYSEPYLGGQNHYAEFAEIAKKVNDKLLQGSDEAIEAMFDEATAAFVNGEKTKAQALAYFRAMAEAQFVRQINQSIEASPVQIQSGNLIDIAIAMPETHVLRWVKDGNSLKAEAEKRGYRAEVQYGDAHQPTQNRQIQNFLTQKAKALVVGCITEGVASVIAEARRDKVVVVAYDRIISNSADYDYYITFNNFKVGVLQAQSIVNGLDLNKASASNPKYITLFAGSPTDGNSFFFFDGAMSVLNPYIDKGVLKVIGPYPRTSADTNNFQRIATENWQAPIAKTRMENLLSNEARSVTLDAVLAPNDKLARAILQACKTDAKYRGKLPITSGQDAEYESAESIKNGEQYSTVFKNTAKLAEAAIILADQILKGQAINIPGAVLADGDLKEIGNTGKKYVKAYLLDPILITKDNLAVPVDAGFYDDRLDRGIKLKN